VIDETCHICFLSDTVEGKEHDKSLADLAHYTLPRGSHLYQDMGFQGFMLDGVTIIQPKKKPRGGELTPPEKAHNRFISSIRIRIEHAIGGVKRYRIVKDKIRLLKDGIRDTIMETCCGLHNFRLQYRPWNYAN
jgi:DDE superfamily endonuclease